MNIFLAINRWPVRLPVGKQCLQPGDQAFAIGGADDIHRGKHSRVVCGAHNFKVGDVVPFAGPGITLPNGAKIEETSIRSELSQGMLCAEDELGISGDHSGLLLLPTGIEPGTLLTTVIPPEPVLVIEVTPNRADCLSIIGIAREVAALYTTELRIPPVVFKEADIPVQQLATVEIQDTEKCLRYVARALLNIRIAPSPLHIRLRLLQAGIRPINNVVDVTNYVMFEYGQPLHAFDRNLLNDSRIVVRCAAAGESMATLDGIERKITPDMLLITDAKRPVALAGVMGGAGSEIRDNTTEVLLESACFQPGCIRRTAKALGLSTESSYRFERGVDPNLADLASRRATQLMIDHAGACAAKGSIDIYPKNPGDRTITCRFNKIRALTGVDYSTKQIVSVFHSLHLKVVKLTDRDCSVLIPSHRPDIEIEADLAEEVMRIDGLDKVPVHPPRSSFVSSSDDTVVRATEACGNAAAGLGLTEILNYSFVSERLLDLFDINDRPSRIVLPNPFSADQSTLRPSLIPQMASCLGYNLARQSAE
ncbi:MAG: phenylalanine--tRNA ligase subunit beta, partial [bacterium]